MNCSVCVHLFVFLYNIYSLLLLLLLLYLTILHRDNASTVDCSTITNELNRFLTAQEHTQYTYIPYTKQKFSIFHSTDIVFNRIYKVTKMYFIFIFIFAIAGNSNQMNIEESRDPPSLYHSHFQSHILIDIISLKSSAQQ